MFRVARRPDRLRARMDGIGDLGILIVPASNLHAVKQAINEDGRHNGELNASDARFVA
jgi:hypothetical protein